MAEQNWYKIGESVTNTVKNSRTYVDADLSRICENMSNPQFRELMMRCRDAAVLLIEKRYKVLLAWKPDEQKRFKDWFGRNDEVTRRYILDGMPRLLDAVRGLKPESIFRWDEQTGRGLTCTPAPANSGIMAEVCKPDSDKRIIAIRHRFCTAYDAFLWTDCKVTTIIHECTHFTDVFDTEDPMYGISIGLTFWAQREPEKALKNADSIAGYIAFFNDRLW
ncbi:M35 family metallo-endopeptidase [Paraburkholderia phymatum]|uniref:M35 family metallo-endopeptidase n=1 Tax=Paraburkholderia phymatum TaxID=148447 RepID=A0ACC6U0L6_9BURK